MVWSTGSIKSHNAIFTAITASAAAVPIKLLPFPVPKDSRVYTSSSATSSPAASASSDNRHYTLNQDGTISAFYEIPEFERFTHNKYVFKGWYLDKESEENPVDWNAVYSGTTHIYAHWIETGTVAKEEAEKIAEHLKAAGAEVEIK